MISVIITALNEGNVLARTINGFFSQTMKDIELIYINDGSTDNTDEQIKPFLDRVIYIKHEKNCGRQKSRNEGVARSKGEYLFVCDADIVIRKDALEKMVNALNENQSYAFSYASFKIGPKLFKSFPFDIERLKQMNYITMSSLVRRKDHPGFDESLEKFQDWDVWLTLALLGKRGYYIPELLFSFGEQKNGLSKWLPSIMYKIPWKKLGIHISKIEKYEHWKEIIQKKHGIIT